MTCKPCSAENLTWMIEPAVLQLQSDRTGARLPCAQQRMYAIRALAIGLEQAIWYAGADVLALAEILGARIVERDADGTVAGIRTLADYDAETATICLYRGAIAHLAELLPNSRDARAVALRLLVAHELFHHIEVTRIGPVPRQMPPVFTSHCGLLWRSRPYVRRTSEIAAHAFATTLVGVPIPGQVSQRGVAATKGMNPISI